MQGELFPRDERDAHIIGYIAWIALIVVIGLIITVMIDVSYYAGMRDGAYAAIAQHAVERAHRKQNNEE